MKGTLSLFTSFLFFTEKKKGDKERPRVGFSIQDRAQQIDTWGGKRKTKKKGGCRNKKLKSLPSFHYVHREKKQKGNQNKATLNRFDNDGRSEVRGGCVEKLSDPSSFPQKKTDKQGLKSFFRRSGTGGKRGSRKPKNQKRCSSILNPHAGRGGRKVE